MPAHKIYKLKEAGFTLIELLVVIAIIGILATIAASTFASSQIKARDAQRKSDLRQVANALEIFHNDHNRYPSGNGSGQIMGCDFNVSTGLGSACNWGDPNDPFQDTEGKVYFSELPVDPRGFNYFYRTDSTFQKFQLYSILENDNDPFYQSFSLDCGEGPASCNFAITSSNTTPTEVY